MIEDEIELSLEEWRLMDECPFDIRAVADAYYSDGNLGEWMGKKCRVTTRKHIIRRKWNMSKLQAHQLFP